MPSTRPDGALDLELVTTGPNAHGYGRLADDRRFAFRVRNTKARLELYRADADPERPAPEDVELVAERSTGSMNLDSTRSITALIRTLSDVAEPGAEPCERTLRTYFGRLETIVDGWSTPLDEEPVPDDQRSAPRRGLLRYLRRNAA
ncbi:MAG TPA: hypothetical protein VGD67_23055 [Pseudonocardiaceae bacterium]